MKNLACETLTKRIFTVREGIGIKSDLQEVCSFTLERCLLRTSEKGKVEEVCPFTLEPVCIKTRALSSGWD